MFMLLLMSASKPMYSQGSDCTVLIIIIDLRFWKEEQICTQLNVRVGTIAHATFPPKTLLTNQINHAVLPLPTHHLGDSMPNRDARLLNLLLRQPRRKTDFQCGLWGKDFVFRAGRVWRNGLLTGDEDALSQTLDDRVC
jgi:hypothetical protein